jgi:hypothetical protein
MYAVGYDTALALKRVREDHQYRQHLLRFCGNDLSNLPPSPPLPQELHALSSKIDETMALEGRRMGNQALRSKLPLM